MTEGPYFTPNSPKRKSIVAAGAAGTQADAQRPRAHDRRPTGRKRAHRLLAGDARGVYDNSGYRFRGHQFTDARGRYALLTVVPGLYPGRTKHIHVKVQAPKEPVLTTQLFFPGVSGNASDGIFDPDCLSSAGGSRTAAGSPRSTSCSTSKQRSSRESRERNSGRTGSEATLQGSRAIGICSRRFRSCAIKKAPTRIELVCEALQASA